MRKKKNGRKVRKVKYAMIEELVGWSLKKTRRRKEKEIKIVVTAVTVTYLYVRTYTSDLTEVHF